MKKIIFFCLIIPFNLALAKKLSLKWDPVAGAKKYELKIEKDGKIVSQIKTSSASWNGDMPPGVYIYQIRGIDEFDRSGEWSQQNLLVAMASKPILAYPVNKSKLTLIDGQDLLLEWEAQVGVTKYHVEVASKKGRVVNTTVNSNQFRISSLPEGTYVWRVKGILKAGPQYPSYANEQWSTESTAKRFFSISYKNFDKPVLVHPVGDVWPTEGGIMEFSWEKVAGAGAYEITIERKGQNSQQPSKNKIRKLISETTSIMANVGSVGSYRWSVRPLAEADASLVKNLPAVQKTYSQFRLLRDYLTEGRASILSASALYTSSDYLFSDIANNYEGAVDSTSISIGLKGEYWLAPNWAIVGGIDTTFFRVNSDPYTRFEANLLIKRRIDLGFGWYLGAAGGLEYRQYPSLSLSDTAKIKIDNLTTLGPEVSFDLSKQFTERWSLRTLLKYYYPALASVEIDSDKNESIRNISFGVQGLYWANKTFGIAAGAFLDNRSLAYSDSTGDKVINIDGVYFFLTAILRIEQ